MIVITISFLIAVAVSVNGDGFGDGLLYAPGHASLDYYSYPKYAFEYSVKDHHTGDDKSQWEKRDGDVVKGAYSLVEPDGNLRVVEYWADDKTGFNAVVKRLGPSLHPVASPASIYKAPIPLLGHASGIAPISVGPVANLGHLANAPLISGPLLAGPLSTANFGKGSIPIGPIAPIIKNPIVPISPIINNPIASFPPIIKTPIAPTAPITSIAKPILPVPFYRSGLYPSAIPTPIFKSGPIVPNYSGYWPEQKALVPAPLPIYQNLEQYGLGDIKAPLSNVGYVNSPGVLPDSWQAPLALSYPEKY